MKVLFLPLLFELLHACDVAKIGDALKKCSVTVSFEETKHC
jgi:hypothetical protein